MDDVTKYAPKSPMNGSDQSDLSGAQLISYCGQAAAHMRQTAEGFRRLLQEMADENERLADDIETMAKLAARRNEMVAARAKAAALGWRDLHAAFAQPLSVNEEPADELLEPDVPQKMVDALDEGIGQIVQQYGAERRSNGAG